MDKKQHLFTKWDIFVLLLLILVGVFFSVWVFLPSNPGDILEIRQNGKVIKTLSLKDNTTETISFEGRGTNTFSIQDGGVSMTDADCGDHTCIQTGRIQNSGESIVCLPHRLVLQIKSSGETDNDSLDGIVH